MAPPATWVDSASLAALKGASAAVAVVDGVVMRNTPEAASWLRKASASAAAATTLPTLKASPTSTWGVPLQRATWPAASKLTSSAPTA